MRLTLRYLKLRSLTGLLLGVSLLIGGCGGSGGEIATPATPFPVGRTLMTLTDTSRTEMFGPTAGGPRKLGVYVWYPSETGTGTGSFGPILPLPVAQQLEAATGVPASLLTALPTQSQIDSPLRSGKSRYPVVVFSHGNGTFPIESSSAAEKLASLGYVVVGIGHTGNAQFSIVDGNMLPGDPAATVDGVTPTPTPTSPFSDLMLYRQNVAAQSQTFVQDIRFVIDELTRLNSTPSLLQSRLNLDRIGVFGYSYGASHALAALKTDSRIDAGVGVDGTVWSTTYKEGTSKPYMIFTGPRLSASEQAAQRETYLGLGYSPTQADEALEWSLSDVLAHLASPRSIRVSMPSALHSNFTDFAVWRGLGFPADEVSDTVPAESLLATYHTYLVAFFEENLKGRRQAILHRESTDPNATVSFVR